MTVPFSRDLTHPGGDGPRSTGRPGAAGATGRTPDVDRPSWAAFTVAISITWLVVAITSILSPDLISGIENTLRADRETLVSPIPGVLATAFASVFVAGSSGGAAAQA